MVGARCLQAAMPPPTRDGGHEDPARDRAATVWEADRFVTLLASARHPFDSSLRLSAELGDIHLICSPSDPTHLILCEIATSSSSLNTALGPLLVFLEDRIRRDSEGAYTQLPVSRHRLPQR